LQAGDGDVVDLRVQSLHRDIEVAVERQLHRVVERQADDGPRVDRRNALRHGILSGRGRGRLSAGHPRGGDANQLLNARFGRLLGGCRAGQSLWPGPGGVDYRSERSCHYGPGNFG